MIPCDTARGRSRRVDQLVAGSLLEKLTGLVDPQDRQKLRGYSLCLKDGSRWWIAGSPRVSFIAEALGGIMQLQEGSPDDSRLFFFYDEDADQNKLESVSLRAQDWVQFYRNSQVFFHSGLHHVICTNDPRKDGINYYLMMSLGVHAMHWESISRGGLPFHAALLEHQGQGVILAATGGTGKSTCSRRVPPPWRACCDDECLAVLTPEGRYMAHPFPTWSDYLWERGPNTWKVEDAVPLAGIFFLEQAPEDNFIPLEGAKAAVSTTQSANQVMLVGFLSDTKSPVSMELKHNIFSNACEFVKKVPAFRLQVSLTGNFWEKIEAALGW